MTEVLVALAATGGAGALALPMAQRWRSQGRLARACAQRRTLVLTYDDGPTRVTSGVLAVLRDHGARASFFALGREAERHPDLLDRALREGHEVGSHSWGHVHPWRSAPWTSARDVRRGLRAVARWTRPRALFRPPHGKLTPATWAIVRASGGRFAWWTVDSGDTWAELPRQDAVVERVRRAGGGVVLLHDSERAPERVRFVLAVTDSLLRAAHAEGLRVARLGDLLSEEKTPC